MLLSSSHFYSLPFQYYYNSNYRFWFEILSIECIFDDFYIFSGMYTMRMLESGTGGGAGTTASNGTILSNQMPTGIGGYPGHQPLTTMQTHPHITMGSGMLFNLYL